jgi:hypothetical protein
MWPLKSMKRTVSRVMLSVTGIGQASLMLEALST